MPLSRCGLAGGGLLLKHALLLRGSSRYKLLHRTGSGFRVEEAKGGGFSYMRVKYERLPLLAEAAVAKDRVTQSLSYHGCPVGKKCALPGRGQGFFDAPNLKLIGDVDPTDVHQGGVGDCWLLSAISALAEFDGAVEKLFEKTSKVWRAAAGRRGVECLFFAVL